MENSNQPKWTWIREENKKNDAKNIDPITGWRYTPLEKYLKAIFPETTDWVHNKKMPRVKGYCRPDFRSDSLKMVVEFDGKLHYTNPGNIIADRQKDEVYKEAGYKVVRIPYFIQLTNEVVEKLFGKKVDEPLFSPKTASLFSALKNTPAYLCPAGVVRMAREFREYPDQYKVNLESLRAEKEPDLTGVELLEHLYGHPDLEVVK